MRRPKAEPNLSPGYFELATAWLVADRFDSLSRIGKIDGLIPAGERGRGSRD
ncbi:MAG TPA: hypothetical protein VJX94_24195 [Stellaceae bacterium]|nr:hypothetical protein [Stellaceae bacterium]